MTGLDVEAVLRDHLGNDDCDDCQGCATIEQYVAHVAAVLRVEIESALGDAFIEGQSDGWEVGHSAGKSHAIFRDGVCRNPYRPTLAATEGDRQ